MRVALVCPYAWDLPGGVQSHVRDLSRVLAARGHEVQVIAPAMRARGAVAADGNVVLAGRALGIPANGSVAPISFGPRAAASVRRALNSFRPDVMHLHEPLIPSLSLIALTTSHCPAVGTFHASAARSAGYAAGSVLLRRALRRVAVRTAVSDAARALVARYFPGDYEMTPNGVDTARLAAAEPLDLGPGRKVLFLSRIERRKGLEVLIQAMTRVRDLGAVLVVAGSGPQEKACRVLASRLGVETLWLGRLKEGDVARVYRSCDLYCAPALGGESFGIVLLEAMAAGAPVVCSDLAAFRTVTGDAASLFPPGDAGRLADAVRKVLTNGNEAERMKEQGRLQAADYDWDRLAAGVESIYERAVAR